MTDSASHLPPPSDTVHEEPGMHRGEPEQSARREPGEPDELPADATLRTRSGDPAGDTAPGDADGEDPGGWDLRDEGYVPL